MTDKSDTVSNESTGAGSGSYSIRGYEYQIDVSVWMALDVILSKQYSDRLVLEPASEEDIEADVGEHEVLPITGTSSMDGYRLIVQSKSRSTDAWTVPSIKRLLEHGVKRESASARLKMPTARYLLVTNAGVSSGVRRLQMNELLLWPTEDLPDSLQAALPPGSKGRVAVFANVDEAGLARRIKELLMDVGKVPTRRLDKCLSALRGDAKSRVMGAANGVWTRDQLIDVIQRHEGHVASSYDTDPYVKPSNWEDILEMMDSKSAALLIGQSGTGKTMTTKALFEALREQLPGLNRVHIGGAREIERNTTPSPVLFDIEDPWGKFDFEHHNREWNQEIFKVFSNATPQRLVIATTRRDVALSAGVLKSVEPWSVALEAESYQPDQRSRLYQSRIHRLPRRLHVLAWNAEEEVLSRLNTPLEIQKFFDALNNQPTTFSPKKSRVQEAIHTAHEESIERTVREQIGQRNDLPAATVLWALLKASDRVSFQKLTLIQDKFSDLPEQLAPRLLKLVQFFVAARNLRQVDSLVSYYHPRVEAGVQGLLKENRLDVRRVLTRLLDVLTSLPGDDDSLDEVATAVLVLKAERSLLEFNTEVSQPAMDKIDRWLNEKLNQDGPDLEKWLATAAVVGSDKNNLAQFARFVQHRPYKTFPEFSNWDAPSRNEAWYTRMSADPAVRRLAQLFVENVLPDTRDDFNVRMVDELEKIDSGIETSFRAAALKVVERGYQNNIDVIAVGALRNIAGFEKVVDAASNVLREVEASPQYTAEEHMNLVNRVYSEEYADWMTDRDDGYTAREYLELYVDRIRARGDWTSIVSHRHKEHLLFPWARSISKAEQADSDELEAAFDLAKGGRVEAPLWASVSLENYPRIRQRLIDRLCDPVGDQDAWLAAFLAMVRVKPEDLPAVVAQLDHGRVSSRAVEMAIELGGSRANPRRDELPSVALSFERAFYGLPRPLQEIAIASFLLHSKDSPILNSNGANHLVAVERPSEDVRAFRLHLSTHLTSHPGEDVRWVLTESEEPDSCALAMEVAARYSMDDEVQAGLKHRFAAVVAVALKEMARRSGVPLPPYLLDFAKSKPSPIRIALADALEEHHHDDHLATLLVLAEDKWSSGSYGHDADLPIAQTAVNALLKRARIDLATANELLRIVRETRDPSLRFAIFDLLVQRAGSAFQKRLVSGCLKGRGLLSSTCARALLENQDAVDREALDAVSAELLASTQGYVAVRLLLLVGQRCTPEFVLNMARDLSGDIKKSVLVLPLLRGHSLCNGGALSHVVGLLPQGHPGVEAVTSDNLNALTSTMLDDLGDARNVAAVVSLLNPDDKSGAIN